jgi:hypothetical protein
MPFERNRQRFALVRPNIDSIAQQPTLCLLLYIASRHAANLIKFTTVKVGFAICEGTFV